MPLRKSRYCCSIMVFFYRTVLNYLMWYWYSTDRYPCFYCVYSMWLRNNNSLSCLRFSERRFSCTILLVWFDWTWFSASQLLLPSQEKWKCLTCCETLKLLSWLALLCLYSGISKTLFGWNSPSVAKKAWDRNMPRHYYTQRKLFWWRHYLRYAQ